MSGVFDRHAFLAITVSSSPILVLLHGANIGSSLVTGAFLLTSTAVLFLFARNWQHLILNEIDYFFLLLIVAVAGSFFFNGVASPKETALLVLSLVAYPACRCFPHGEVRSSFVWVTSAIVAVGSLATGLALIDQRGSPAVKPIVFGFDHTATVFLASLGFIFIALVSNKLDARRTATICALLFLPTFIFSASTVRFTFVAIFISLFIAASTSTQPQRKFIYIIIVTIGAAMSAGYLVKYRTMSTLTNYTITGATSAEVAEDNAGPGMKCGVVAVNSVAIRRVLYRDAIRAILGAGIFGRGLMHFEDVSCFKGTYPHNYVLQSFVEFGWLGGAAITLLSLMAFVHLWPIARQNSEAKFVLCCLAYVATIDMAHGSVSSDALLFLFLGYSARVYENSFWSQS
jgi:hypothetical protein